MLYYHVERQEGQASKLLMRNQIYRVVERVEDGNLYRLSLVARPTKVLTAHVDQLTLYLGELEPADDGDDVGESAEQTLDDLRVNQYAVFVLRGEPASHLRVAEITAIEEGLLSAQFWHYIDRTRTTRLDPTKPLAERRLAPEWANKASGESLAGTPKPQQLAAHERLITTYRVEGSNPDVIIVVPAFNMESGGKVPKNICRRAEQWRCAREAEQDTLTPSSATQTLLVSMDDCYVVAAPDEPAEAAVLLGHVRGTPDVLQTVEVLMRGRRRRVNAAHLPPYDATLVGRCIQHPVRKSRDGVRNRMIRNPGPQDSAAAAGRGSRPHGSGPKGRDGMATAQTQLSQGVST